MSPEFIKNPTSNDNIDERFTLFFYGRENAAQSNPQMSALSGGLAGENLQWPVGGGNLIVGYQRHRRQDRGPSTPGPTESRGIYLFKAGG